MKKFFKEFKEFVSRGNVMDMAVGIIIGGANYGQGSSREHAALVPLYLGIKAVITKSFARIHCANLVNAGIIPFTFANEADYDRISVNDELCLEEIRESIANGTDVTLKNLTTGESYKLSLQAACSTIRENRRSDLNIRLVFIGVSRYCGYLIP